MEGGGSAGLAMLSTVLVARLLGPTDFGAIMSIFTVVQVGSYFAENTFNDALVRRPQLGDDHTTTAYAASIAIGVALAVAFAVGNYWIAGFFGDATLGPAVVLAGFTLILNGLCSVPMTLLRHDLRFRDLALRTIYARIAGTVTVVVALACGLGIWSVVVQNLAAGAVNVACLVPLMRRASRGRVTWAALRDLIPVSVFSSSTMLLAVIAQRVFLVLISVLFGPLALGLYMIGLRTVDVLRTLLQNSARQLLFRRMAVRQSDMAAMRRLYLDATQLGAAVTLPVFTGIYLCAPQIITVFLQPQWHGAVDAFRGFCIASALFGTRMFDGLVYNTLGRAQMNLILTAAAVATYLAVLSVIYVTGVGSPVDAMIAQTVIATLISAPIVARAINLQTRDQFGGLLMILAAVAVMTGAVLWVRHSFLSEATPLRTLVAMAAVGALTYALALLVVAPRTFHQFRTLALGR